jgi:hypothetical protein
MGSAGTEVVMDLGGYPFNLQHFEEFIKDVFLDSGADTGVLHMHPRTREVFDRAFTDVSVIGAFPDDAGVEVVRVTLRSGAYTIAEREDMPVGEIEVEIGGYPFGLMRNFAPAENQWW